MKRAAVLFNEVKPGVGDSAKKTGYFLLSLDTELAWGYFDCFRPQMFSAGGWRERRSVDLLLDVFDEFNITATWAVVGHLFHERYQAGDAYPSMDWNGRYPVFERLYKNSSPLLYGADIIDTLLTRGSRHEIAFHGYTHKVLSERAMSKEEARAEIVEWLRVSKRKNIVPRTVIFPRNKIGHLDLFNEYGFLCYRGEELMPKAYSLPLAGRVFRRLYHYLAALSTPLVYECKVDSSGLVNLPSSRWLFGLNRRVEWVLDSLNLHHFRIRQLIKGVEKAAVGKKIIHIWAHPHEFQTNKDIEKLRYLLGYVADEVSKGRMQSVGMAALARKAIDRHQQMNVG